MGFSLGKLNYCLQALNKKRLVKINNFRNNNNKINYIYILTLKGISEKTKPHNQFYEKKNERVRRVKKRSEENNVDE